MTTTDPIVDDALTAGRHPEHDRYREPRCPWCSSAFHGLPRQHVCDGSLVHHDDSWRRHAPTDWIVREQALMDATGCDGWVARELCRVNDGYSARAIRRHRVHAALTGRPQRQHTTQPPGAH